MEKVAQQTKYIQLALIELFCSDWVEDDRFFILMTEGAKQRNWQLLEKEFEKISGGLYIRNNLKVRIKPVDIPDGFVESEIMKIFETVFDLIEEGDEIFFDITHSFRSIPFVGSVIFNYSGLLKSAKIRKVVYGAFEKLGLLSKVKEIPLEERFVPIVDLSTFVYLNELTSAVGIFDKTGDIAKLSNLFNLERKKIFSKQMKDLGDYFSEQEHMLTRFNISVKFVRGKDIDKIDFQKVLSPKQFPSEFPKVFESLFKQFSVKLENAINENEINFSLSLRNEVKNQLIAIAWCIEHDLVQQGFTLLRELIITRIMLKLGSYKKEEVYDEKKRMEIEKKITDGIDAKKEKAIIKESSSFLNQFDKDITLYDQIKNLRNDINHGGFRKSPRSPDSLRNTLQKLFKLYIDILKEDYEGGSLS